ncbi:ABC-type transport auxiliary lipoprotein family protein [Dokdonella sp.]|uniref:ABC-type transport auxiliary lipoprotein family protein n=1 Tax=Dokdonella sp. TaxID=2291710 RepID=UPI001B166780|nr:ABC-type transport auxiliary lipoprotein family protein [Dokdonella sp.]MBO9664728.1 membrane integrity-associated transporter subunit PqiC [Dokdonella sp.]
MRTARFAILLFALASLAGCSSLLGVQSRPFTVYSPSYHAPDPRPAGPSVDWQLAVETPLSSEALNTSRIVVMPSRGVIEVIPGARWSDPAPTLLRHIVVQGFEESGRIIGVGSSAVGLRADYSLVLDLHDFQAELRDGTAYAKVGFHARLLDYSTNRVLAAQGFAAEIPFSIADQAGAFAAFETSVSRTVTELVEWTLREGNAARTKTSPK